MKATSVVRITKQEKLARLGGVLAIKAAQAANDPLYKKYEKARERYLSLKEKIIQKYRPVARRKVREALRKKD